MLSFISSDPDPVFSLGVGYEAGARGCDQFHPGSEKILCRSLTHTQSYGKSFFVCLILLKI